MSDHKFDRAVRDWLEDGSDRTPRSAIDGVLLAVKTTPQERDLRIPWRFPFMPALSRASGLAAVVIVAVIGVGALVYFASGRPGGVGGQASPTPTATPTLPPGITGWTTYTSKVYGYTIGYPSDWSVHTPATHKWQPGEPYVNDAWPSADTFASPDVDDQIGMFVWQVPAPVGADLDTWEGLQAAFLEVCEVPTFGPCEIDTRTTTSTQMCLGRPECSPALVVLLGTGELVPFGFFGDPETGTITVFNIGRPDDFPTAERYGGSIALLKAILTQVDVRPPQPGETPH